MANISSILPVQTWGAPGDDINQRIALALMEKNFSQQQEIRSPWQGAAQMANSLIGGLMYRKAMNNQAGIAQALGSMAFPGAAPAPAQSSGGPFGGIADGIGNLFGGGNKAPPTPPPAPPPMPVQPNAPVPGPQAPLAAPPPRADNAPAAPPVQLAQARNIASDGMPAPIPPGNIPPNVINGIVQIESGGNPHARTGSYTGVLQMGPDERRKYGGDSLQAGTALLADRAAQFRAKFGRDPTPGELYLEHQQGLGGLSAQMQNPDAPAWQNMYSTAEGQQKGAGWARQAIWGNLPDSAKRQFGSVDNVTGKDFMNWWQGRVARAIGQPNQQVADNTQGGFPGNSQFQIVPQLPASPGQPQTTSNDPNFVPMPSPQLAPSPMGNLPGAPGSPPVQPPMPPPRPLDAPQGANTAPFQIAQNGGLPPMSGPQGAPQMPPAQVAPQQTQAPPVNNPMLQMIDARLGQMKHAYDQLMAQGNNQGAMWLAQQANALQMQKMQLMTPQVATLAPGAHQVVTQYGPNGQLIQTPLGGAGGDGILTPDAQDMVIGQYFGGNPQALTSLGRGTIGNLNTGNTLNRMADQVKQGKYTPQQYQQLASQLNEATATRDAQIKGTKDFSTGQQGNTVRSFSVAADHLQVLKDVSTALANGNYKLANSMWNEFNRQTGKSEALTVDAVKSVVNDELTKAILASNGALGDREEMAGHIATANSPKQIADVIGNGYMPLVVGQLHGFANQYKFSTKKNDFRDMLSPSVRKLMGPPQPGEVEQGYQFLGGDPNNKNSWRQVQ